MTAQANPNTAWAGPKTSKPPKSCKTSGEARDGSSTPIIPSTQRPHSAAKHTETRDTPTVTSRKTHSFAARYRARFGVSCNESCKVFVTRSVETNKIARTIVMMLAMSTPIMDTSSC